VFKYSAFLGLVKRCPPSNYIGLDLEAFRVVKSDPLTEESFVPAGVDDEGRLHPGNDQQNCCCYGLSFFDSEEALRERMRELKKRIPLLERKLGSMVAVGRIEPDDGVGQPEIDGHFTFHEQLP
jgi:hypothetical protein